MTFVVQANYEYFQSLVFFTNSQFPVTSFHNDYTVNTVLQLEHAKTNHKFLDKIATDLGINTNLTQNPGY